MEKNREQIMGQYIKSILRKYTRIIVWGTGNFYRLYKDLLGERVVYFVDNDAAKWGTSLDKKHIFSPEKLKDEDTNGTLVIVCNHYFEEISVQIKQYGNFDIIDIVTMWLVQKKERESAYVEPSESARSIVVCGGIHAMWQTNGSRKFIDGQLEQLRQAGFYTIEIVPLLYYEAGRRESSVLAVSVNGIYQGLFSVSELAERHPKVRGMVIHSLYYSQETMKSILDSIIVETRVLYYIHDYSCLCFYRFLYKDKKPCIGIDGNMDCDICAEDKERRKLLRFHQSVFEKYKVLLIAPSKDTRKRVERYYKNVEIVSLPHLEFEQECFNKQVNCRIKIAYIGTAIWHKGWEAFTRLVDRFYQKYEFYCMGDCPDDLKIQNVTYIPVGLKESDNVLTMTEALLRYSIDIAYIGSIWPETYSYTYYEAYEAGCFILTNTKSGNVCSQVNANQNGVSFSSDSEMMAWLEKDAVQRDVLSVNKRIMNVQNSKAFLKYFK